jgi:prepilin-type N-terminal cleavage/methylation domain-containing protein
MSRRGLTLLELLVALSVLALAAVVAGGGLGVLGRALERERRETAAVGALAAAQELVRRELGRALPLDWGPPRRPLVAFLGTADRVRFVTAPPAWHAGSGLQLWELALEDAGRGRVLRVRRAELVRDGSGFDRLAEAEAVTLATVAPGRGFAFFGPDEDGRGRRWWERWDGRPVLPEAVRLGDPEGPGALVVRLLVDTPLACLGARGSGGAACG